MNTPVATVVSIAANGAVVAVEPAAVCARCAAGKGCGAGLFGGARPVSELQVGVARGLALSVGERVYLSLEPVRLLQAALLAYGLPLLGILIALCVAWLLRGSLSDAVAAAAATVGMLAGILLGRFYLRKQDCLRHFVPVIRRRVANDPLAVP